MVKSENRDISNDPVFKDSLSKISKGNYLGDMAVVNQLLRFYVSELVGTMQRESTTKSKMTAIRKLSGNLSAILLGKSTIFQPSKKWNEDGGIDVFCSKWLGIDDKNSDVIMEHAALMFFDEVLDVSKYASLDGVLEEQWGWQLDGIIEKYSALFLGVSPGQMLAMEVNDD